MSALPEDGVWIISGTRELFDTGDRVIGLYRHRDGREAPTSRGVIHHGPDGAHILPARPLGWAYPTDWHDPRALAEDLLWSASRALKGQSPAELAAYSVEADPAVRLIRLRAHFDATPSEAALEDMLCVETEIFCDYGDAVRIETGVEVMAPGAAPHLLASGAAYRREPSAS